MSTRIIVCPGSFDPITFGHLDVIRRAKALADEIVIAIGVNPAKVPMLEDQTRLELTRQAVADIPGIRVELVSGLIADYCRHVGASAIVKGIRGGSDFDHELPMALMNQHLSGVETVFVTADPKLTHISSSLVRELAQFGRDVSDLVPAHIAEALKQKVGGGDE
ncbi:MAG TPA: pantetheine-phosphate adenylyltransferase [Beutenbergiaceae bacterium]|nr:pantetheine-phosphate adenylyltransferase [Beutenbergiaceae bacterium]